MKILPSSKADKLGLRYEIMRPRLAALTNNDRAALRSFDKTYHDLIEQLSRRGNLEIHGEGYGEELTYEGARLALEWEFDDCLPEGAARVNWGTRRKMC